MNQLLKNVVYRIEKVKQDALVERLNLNGLNLCNQPQFDLKQGDVIDGLLKLPKKDIEIPLLVLKPYNQQDLNLLNCKYYNNANSVKTYLKSHYSPEFAAMGLKKLRQENLKPQLDGSANWYYDGYDCELYFVEKESRLIRFRIAFLGLYLESQIPGATRFAHYETEAIASPGMSASKVVYDQTYIKTKDKETLLKFVSYIADLNDDYRTTILNKIKNIPEN